MTVPTRDVIITGFRSYLRIRMGETSAPPIAPGAEIRAINVIWSVDNSQKKVNMNTSSMLYMALVVV